MIIFRMFGYFERQRYDFLGNRQKVSRENGIRGDSPKRIKLPDLEINIFNCLLHFLQYLIVFPSLPDS